MSGGVAGKGEPNGNSASNGHARDIESNLTTSNTPAKTATPISKMPDIKKYEITEVGRHSFLEACAVG